MRRILLAVALTLSRALGADAVPDIERTLAEFSAALAKGNAQTLRELAGPGFTLLDEGRVHSLDETIASARAVLLAGQMTRVPLSIRTEIRGSVAWTRYEVAGELRTKEGRVPLALVESAVLEHSGGRWRVVQMATIPKARQN